MDGCTAAVLQPTVHPSYSKIYLTDPNEPRSARPAVRELHSSTDLHGMPDLDHCTELHGTHAAALQASRGCMSLHGSFLQYWLINVSEVAYKQKVS